MSEFDKWFKARARNPDRITLEEAFAAGERSQPAQRAPDSIIADAARYQFLRNGGAYLEPNEGEIYMATDYGAKYYKDLRGLDMDIDEALTSAKGEEK